MDGRNIIMDTSVSISIDTIDDNGTYLVNSAVQSSGAIPIYKFQRKEILIQVLNQIGIAEDEINNAIANHTSIYRENIDQQKLERELAPYASR
jgi:hypothetical protein